MNNTADVAILGAGILGLAHAYAAASGGMKFIVFERSPRVPGASVWSFGMIWRIGQPHGKMHQLALRSRSRWVEVLDQENRNQVLARSGAVVADGLIGGFWSGMEPTVGSADLAAVETGNERWIVDRVIVCDGDDFETLYPETFTASRLTCVMLQMLRTAPQPEGWQLGPALAAGLTLRLYQASETAQGELTLGDSHEYGRCVNIFNRDEVDDLILGYIRGFLNAPVMQIAQRWHGVYAKHLERPYLATTPAPGVQIVTSPGSVGTTLAFGIAEETIEGMATENMEH